MCICRDAHRYLMFPTWGPRICPQCPQCDEDVHTGWSMRPWLFHVERQGQGWQKFVHHIHITAISHSFRGHPVPVRIVFGLVANRFAECFWCSLVQLDSVVKLFFLSLPMPYKPSNGTHTELVSFPSAYFTLISGKQCKYGIQFPAFTIHISLLLRMSRKRGVGCEKICSPSNQFASELDQFTEC